MCSKNREYVQRGLDLRRAQRQEEARQRTEAEQEAAQEAAGREMRREINSRVNVRRIEKETAERCERRDREAAERRAARRKQETAWAKNWNRYIGSNFWMVAAFAAVVTLAKIGAVDRSVAFGALALSAAYCFVNFISYMACITKRENRKKITNKESQMVRQPLIERVLGVY